MIFSSRSFFQKNEQTNSTLLLWNLRSNCFRLFFGRNWRHQKDISKLTDLYCIKWFTSLCNFLFFRISDTYASNYFADRSFTNLDKYEYIDSASKSKLGKYIEEKKSSNNSNIEIFKIIVVFSFAWPDNFWQDLEKSFTL